MMPENMIYGLLSLIALNIINLMKHFIDAPCLGREQLFSLSLVCAENFSSFPEIPSSRPKE